MSPLPCLVLPATLGLLVWIALSIALLAKPQPSEREWLRRLWVMLSIGLALVLGLLLALYVGAGFLD